MFFKAVKDKFKRRSGAKSLAGLLERDVPSLDRPPGIRSLGCIVNLDTFEKADVFYELLEEFSLRPNAVKIIGYKKLHDKNSPYALPVFSDKDLGWNGRIENSYALEFLNREYDVIINYYKEDNLLLNLMSIQSKARIKVGFVQVGKAYNDIMLQTPYDDFKLFKSELKKYLGILKEI
ncbi:DUF6913 domain-containing protein [Maribacter sp. 2307ULW6-5]|uniref:DUF6913 domain-containing protein n=1 Tax=Maribacter sp. 2307ULW6-5 TaxID=3386275 RepID=UPI0039BD89B6